MRISEIIAEAISPIGSTSDLIKQDGLPTTANPTAPSTTAPPTDTTAPPAAPGTLPTQQTGSPAPTNAAAQPALQQGMKSTMTDLDKIAAQIVGLKQKQQQMQQQMQQPVR